MSVTLLHREAPARTAPAHIRTHTEPLKLQVCLSVYVTMTGLDICQAVSKASGLSNKRF